MSRVAVTGVGLICALGHTARDCWEQCSRGETGIRPLTDPGVPAYKFQQGAQVRGLDLAERFAAKDSAFLERFAQLAVLAAREAVTQSGLIFNQDLSECSAVITGTSVGGQFAEEEGYYRLYKLGNPKVPPLTIPRTMSNAGASAISLEFGIRGPVYTVSTACSSSNHALGQAFWMIRNGQITAALAGGSEAVFAEGLLRAWEAMRVVSPDVCRPFSLGRKGLILGEGAAMLALEDWDHALARGATIHGEIVGFGMSSDAHHITQPSALGPANAMRWAIRDAGLASADIHYINAHGTGTLANDSTEAEAIRSVFDACVTGPYVSSTKSMHGHTLGAAGAIEAAITLLALAHQTVPPTINFIEPDPACNLNLVPNLPRQASLEYAMSNTFAFGGLNASLVLRRAPK